MARIFADGEELTNKKDFDNKVNTDRSLYLVKQGTPLTYAQLFNTNDSQGRLQAIHQRVDQSDSDTFGQYDNLLLFGGDDITSVLNMSLYDHQMKVSIGGADGVPKWTELIAWKSDIDELKQEILSLKKQIGGVLRTVKSFVQYTFTRNEVFA